MQPQATDISEPEPIYVRELEETIEINDVKPSDPDPRQAALTWSAGQGYIDLHSLTEHERQLRFSYERNARDYSWTRGPADEWYARNIQKRLTPRLKLNGRIMSIETMRN